MVVNCANNTPGDILGVFYARIKAKHCTTGENMPVKSMVYVMKDPQYYFQGKHYKILDVFRQTFRRLDSLKMQTWHTCEVPREGG